MPVRMIKDIPMRKKYERTCPGCLQIIKYQCKNWRNSRSSYIRAERKKSKCFDCTVPGRSLPPRSEETKRKLSRANRGEKGSNWKGGVNRLNNTIRNLSKYKQWRTEIFSRDEYSCQKCLNKGGRLNAHHIYSLSYLINKNSIKTTIDALNCDELWSLDNAQTLCEPCHNNLHIEKGYGTKGEVCEI